MPQTHQSQNSEKSRTSKPAAQQTATQARGPAPLALQSALADPLSASADQIVQLQRQYGNRAVQRLIQRAQAKDVQRKAAVGLEGGAVEGGLQNQINSARGGGQPLDRTVGSKIGGALGADFNNVRVHTDSKSDNLNRSLSAKAFTLGSDVFFSKGAYNPGTHSGKQLLAHELTHVVQQTGGAGKQAPRQEEQLPQPPTPATEPFITTSTEIVAQRTMWSWVNGAWAAQDQDEPQTAQPNRDGTYDWETIDTGTTQEEEAAEPVVLTITYGAAHGDRHFGGRPTANKSKWSITKDAAKTLMQAEITNRMQDIVDAATAARDRRIAWILIADSPNAIGDAVGVAGITRFQIQLQANLTTGDISYHGFPDEQALHTGLGPSRNSLT